MRIDELTLPFTKPFKESSKLSGLKKYNRIGWDIDKTLIENPNSVLLQTFILENPQIEHYIITYRSHGYEKMALRDIGSYNILSKNNFSGMYSIPYELWSAFNECKFLRKNNELTGPLEPEEIEYHAWKPKTCHEEGIPLLVDDRYEDLKGPCQEYNVDLIDPFSI
jgi:hypothetical protein